MALWQEVIDLCKISPTFHQCLSQFYGQINFPITIRIQQAAWIEQQNWTFEMTTEDGRAEADSLLKQMIALIQSSIQQHSTDQPYEKIMELEIILSNLHISFDSNPGSFIEIIKRCLSEERNLIARFRNDAAVGSASINPQQVKARENFELIRKLEAVRKRMDEASVLTTEVEGEQELLLVDIRNKTVHLTALQTQPGYGGYTPEQAQVEHVRVQQSMNTLTQHNLARRNNLLEVLISIAIDLANLVKLVWDEITQWHITERKQMIGQPCTSEGALDKLEKLCYVGGELLHRLIGQIDTAIGICDKIVYQIDPHKQSLEKVMQELKDSYLPNYLRRAFIVEQNIPDRILKILSGNKSAPFSMSVRLLGGASLGLGFSKSTVKMSVFYEAQIPKEDDYKAGYVIDNSTERPFVVSNTCVAHFHTVRILQFRRPTLPKQSGTEGNNDELVTEQKFSFIFYTVINICGRQYPIKVVSEPVIFISQTSQEIMAKGTLIWDAAYSEVIRKPYEYKEQVKWIEVASVLNSLFTTHTGRGLNEDQMRYLAKMAFRSDGNNVSDFGAYAISEKQVIKNKLDGRDFSFWKWFWACMNLTKDYVRQEWNDGLIYGFITKEDAKDKLMSHDCGTFLLRFSEGNIEQCQKANVCGFLTVAVVEKDPATGNKRLFHVRDYLESKEIQSKKGLGVILDAMQVNDYDHPGQKKKLLQHLWPDVNSSFQERFKIEQPGLKTIQRSPYQSARIIIEICLGTQQRQPANVGTSRQESMDSVASGQSVAYSPAQIGLSVAYSPAASGQSLVHSPAQNSLSDEASIGDILAEQMRQSSRPINSVVPMINNSMDQNGSNGTQAIAESGSVFDGTYDPSVMDNSNIMPDITDLDFDMASVFIMQHGLDPQQLQM